MSLYSPSGGRVPASTIVRNGTNLGILAFRSAWCSENNILYVQSDVSRRRSRPAVKAGIAIPPPLVLILLTLLTRLPLQSRIPVPLGLGELRVRRAEV